MKQKIFKICEKLSTPLLVGLLLTSSAFFLVITAQENFFEINSKNLQAQLINDFQHQKIKNKKRLELQKKFIKRQNEAEIERNKKYTFVIAPHPDDEILCCGRTLREKIEAGKNIKIIFFTQGEALSKNIEHSKNYGKIRVLESVKAAKKLGLKDEDLFFLDFPDGYLEKLNNKYAITSEFTNQKNSEEIIEKRQTPYTLPHLENLLEKIFKKYTPEEIYVPDEVLDYHSDHKTASKITQKLIKKHKAQFPNITFYKYIIHNHNNYGKGKYFDKKKLDLIQTFQSQYHTPKHKEFLENFARLPENFKKISF